jgi:hypothetical protein
VTSKSLIKWLPVFLSARIFLKLWKETLRCYQAATDCPYMCQVLSGFVGIVPSAEPPGTSSSVGFPHNGN